MDSFTNDVVSYSITASKSPGNFLDSFFISALTALETSRAFAPGL